MGSWTEASGQAAVTGPWEQVTESWEAEVKESWELVLERFAPWAEKEKPDFQCSG